MSQKYKCYISSGLLWSLCLLIIFGASKVEMALNQCKLCDMSYTSCSMQFPEGKFSDEDCRMKVYQRNSTECSSLELGGQSQGSDAGKVVVQSYLFTRNLDKIAAFNVSFSEFNWKSITMRFMQNGNPKKNTCRSFKFSEKFLSEKPTSLFYDCLWSRQDYELKTFNFEYSASDGISSVYRKYVLSVPRGEKIDPALTSLQNWQVFMYVDISNSPSVTLKAETVPKTFNVTTYKVMVYSGTENDKVLRDEKILTVHESEREFTFDWHLGIFPRNYFFTVQPVSDLCGASGCLVSRSPYLMIEDSPYLIFIGTLFALIFLLTLIIAFVKYISQGGDLAVKPKLLLIYRSTHSSHIKVVLEIAEHLRKNCNIEAMVDELDVNKSETHNPFYWYNDAVAQADFIAIVSSPTCCNSICGIYPQVDKAALGILRGKGFQQEKSSNMYNLMVFLLPYCSANNLPPEAKNIGLRFNVPCELNGIINYVHNFRRKHVIGRLYYWFRCIFEWNLKYKRASWKKYPEMHAAIQEASAEVSKCLAKGNKAELKNLVHESNKKIPHIQLGASPQPQDQPTRIKETISESSNVSDIEPYRSFPGNIDDYDLLGNASQFSISEAKPDNKVHLLLDEYVL